MGKVFKHILRERYIKEMPWVHRQGTQLWAGSKINWINRAALRSRIRWKNNHAESNKKSTIITLLLHHTSWFGFLRWPGLAKHRAWDRLNKIKQNIKCVNIGVFLKFFFLLKSNCYLKFSWIFIKLNFKVWLSIILRSTPLATSGPSTLFVFIRELIN